MIRTAASEFIWLEPVRYCIENSESATFASICNSYVQFPIFALMKVSGFSFIKNAVKFGYPVTESIQSVLPLCDEFVIAVGDCNDGTRELIQSINDTRIKIIDTVWNENLRTGGAVLADETNKAFQAIAPDSDWAFYIQGDEVLHEQDYDPLRRNLSV